MADLFTALRLIAGVLVIAFGGMNLFDLLVRRDTGDRKRIGFNADDPVWSGKFARTIPIEVPVSLEQAMQIATTAIQRAGGRELQMWDASTVVGWWSRFAFMMEADRQLAVVVTPTGSGSVQMLCCCRPRHRKDHYDFGVTSQRVSRLAKEVRTVLAQQGIPEGSPWSGREGRA